MQYEDYFSNGVCTLIPPIGLVMWLRADKSSQPILKWGCQELNSFKNSFRAQTPVVVIAGVKILLKTESDFAKSSQTA